MALGFFACPASFCGVLGVGEANAQNSSYWKNYFSIEERKAVQKNAEKYTIKEIESKSEKWKGIIRGYNIKNGSISDRDIKDDGIGTDKIKGLGDYIDGKISGSIVPQASQDFSADKLTGNYAALDGSQITNLNPGNISAGTLPALNGSQITDINPTNITGSGNLNIGNGDLFVDDVSGNVGIGTTTPMDALSVVGDGYLSGALNVGDATTTRGNLGLEYASATDLNFYNVAMWGDSLTEGTAEQLIDMYSNHNVYDGGVGGESSTQIKDRMVLATDKHKFISVIWAGNNNANETVTVKADIATMIGELTTTKQYLVIGLSINASYPSGTGTYNTVKQLNAELNALYPNNFFDVHDYLVNNALSDAGITPTAQDLTDIANDVVPTSLRIGDIHLTPAIYRLVSQQIINFIDTNYSPTDKVLSYANVEDIFLNPPVFGTFNMSENSQIKYNNVILAQASTTLSSYFFGGAGTIAITNTGTNNIAIGDQSFTFNTTGNQNTAYGGASLYANTTGSKNVANGYKALYFNTTGFSNTSVGFQSLMYNTTGSLNTANGSSALFHNVSGSSNTANGASSLVTNTTGNYNTATGTESLRSNNTGYNNSAFGYQSGVELTTGNNNILLGYGAGDNLTTGSSNIVVGYNIDSPTAINSNTMTIGNLIYGTGIDGMGTNVSNGNIGIGTNDPKTKLEVDGIIKTKERSSATCDADTKGGIYFDSDDNHFYGCNGTVWVQLDN